jgi:hypothetical protein
MTRVGGPVYQPPANSIIDNSNGTYTMTYAPRVAGSYTVSVTYSGALWGGGLPREAGAAV